MIRILLVEDNEADVVLMQEALRAAGLSHDLTIATDGERALESMRVDSRRPDLVLLDLNLPRKDGREVLEEAKGDPALASMPIIVLTTSQSPRDVNFAYEHRANAYVRKPNGLDSLIGVAHSIRDFWLGAATLPGHAPV